MPILDVELVLAPGEMPVSDLAARLADAAAQVFASAPGQTWVKLHFLEANLYAENGGEAATIHPVFVTVLKSIVPAAAELQAEIRQLSAAIAQACDRAEENVHIMYQPGGGGRVAFGGKLVGS
jgi:phenylpyruvate tautomerase PptA (4-oxalocrotonate tautomerase family)